MFCFVFVFFRKKKEWLLCCQALKSEINMHSFFYFVAQWRSVDFWCSLQKFIYTVDALYLLNWNIKVGSRRTPSSLSVAPLSMEMSSGSLLICVFSPFDSNTSGICLSSCCTWSTPYRTSSFALLLLLHSLIYVLYLSAQFHAHLLEF